MKMKKSMFLWLFLAVLALVGGYLGLKAYNDQFVTLGETRYEKVQERLDLSGRELPELETLKAFTQLKKLDLRKTKLTREEFETLKSWFPDCEISWDPVFQGVNYPADTREFSVEALDWADLKVLEDFPELKAIHCEKCPDFELLQELQLQRPELQLDYPVPLGGVSYTLQTRELELAGVDGDELASRIPYLPALTTVKLAEPLPPAEQLLSLAAQYPQIAFSWDLTFKDIPLNQDTTKLDLTNMEVTVEEVEAVIAYLPKLEKVEMTGCGISNEEMDALNRRHENVSIVWTVTLGGGLKLRTDITAFMPWKYKYTPQGDDLANLKYCTEITAMDLGHMPVTNCNYCAYMPHLRYLILADTQVQDLTPLTGLTELAYLEIFKMTLKDSSALLTLTGLEDLNISFTKGKGSDPHLVAKMTWLKNLWWHHMPETHLSWEQSGMLKEALPNTKISLVGTSSTGGGWRDLPNYFAQRDAFGMGYMKG